MSTLRVRFFKDTKSIFEILVSFSFFLKIQRCTIASLSQEKLPNQIIRQH